MVSAYKLIAVLIAYGALWEALSHWRVRAPERKLQLQLFGAVTLLYVLLTSVTGGLSPSLLLTHPSPGMESLDAQYIHAFFGLFASVFLLLGILEMGIGVGFSDPSLPLLSRWWMRALFEGPVWKLLCQRLPGTPLTPDEAEACARHLLAGFLTAASALWGLQIATGSMEWGHFDPVALVIALKAINIWLDSRLRNRVGAAEMAAHLHCTLPANGAVYRNSRY